MVLAYVISSICLLYMLALVGSFGYKFISLNRKGRLDFIKGFKKGKFALIYLAAIALFFLGSYYDGTTIGGSLLTAIKNSVDVVVLKYNYGAVEALMQDNLLYCITTSICFCLVALNAVLFTMAVFGQKLYNYVEQRKIYAKEQKVCVLIGDNKENRSIIKSAKREKMAVLLLVKKITDEIRDYAFAEKIAVDVLDEDKAVGTQITTSFKNCEQKLINVIVNTENDASDLVIVEKISQAIISNGLEKLSVMESRGLNCYVFGEPENESAFGLFTARTKGCVRYVNKYKLIAMEFVGKYPLTQFMTEKQIDYASATIKPEVEMNVVMIGFGKANRQVFLTSVANNQFLTKDKESGEIKEKAVNYFIYDSRKAEQDKQLNHDYFRFANKYDYLQEHSGEYLDLPQKPAKEVFIEKDVNDADFYSSIKANLKNGGENAYNYVLVGYGTDMENLDFAEKIYAKLVEWEVVDKTKLFIKIRDDELSKEVIEPEYAKDGKFIVFGNEGRVVYDVRQIFAEQHEQMAKDKHVTYVAMEYFGKKTEDDGLSDEEREKHIINTANEYWYESMAQIQRDSNTYACLSIRMKLHLLGFDFKKGIHEKEDASKEFIKAYQEGDKIERKKEELLGWSPVEYGDCNFPRGTIRNNYATQEHLRWNAYHICHGYVPATKEETIANDKQKLIAKRRHRNILSYKGLLQFCDLMMAETGGSRKDCDVIKYDYEIMDDLPWLASRIGYTIVKK